MLLYIITLQATIIGGLVYKRHLDKKEAKWVIHESGEVGAQYVDLIHKHEEMRQASATLLKAYETLTNAFKELQADYASIAEHSAAQAKLVEEQYEMIQSYDSQVISLENKLDNIRRLKIN